MDTVSTVLENLVFIIPISKKILEITGIEVIAKPMVKTSPNAISFSASPIKADRNIEIKGIAPNMGRTVAPANTQAMVFVFSLSTSSFVL